MKWVYGKAVIRADQYGIPVSLIQQIINWFPLSTLSEDQQLSHCGTGQIRVLSIASLYVHIRLFGQQACCDYGELAYKHCFRARKALSLGFGMGHQTCVSMGRPAWQGYV